MKGLFDYKTLYPILEVLPICAMSKSLYNAFVGLDGHNILYVLKYIRKY